MKSPRDRVGGTENIEKRIQDKVKETKEVGRKPRSYSIWKVGKKGALKQRI